MKKKIIIIIAIIIVIALIGFIAYYLANNKVEQESNNNQSEEVSEIEENINQTDLENNLNEENEMENTTDNSTSSNILVVYFSATGNTENVAKIIAEKTGADLFEIEPVDPYTEEDLSYTDENSRVSIEHNDESLQNIELVSSTADDWDSYDTVLIGYPIWWGEASWVVSSFVQNNDFTGKTVIPFCTSSSSDIGQSGTLLAKKAGTGDWQEGQRFGSSANESTIVSWLEEIGLIY